MSSNVDFSSLPSSFSCEANGSMAIDPSVSSQNLVLASSSQANQPTCMETIKKNLAKYKVTASGELRKIVDYMDHHPRLVQTLKISAAALVVGGLITASIFSFGAAIPLVISASSIGPSAIAGPFALMGTAIGLAISSVVSLDSAIKFNMYKVTNHNLQDTVNFVGISLLLSITITGLLASMGANFRLRYMGISGLLGSWAIHCTCSMSLLSLLILLSRD